jgi:hypothetical protein
LFPPLLVFADDWGRHPSSCQHLVGHLLSKYHVDWINTIGTREPKLDLATFRRGYEKISNWLHRKEMAGHIPAQLRVMNPKMWPWLSRPFDRALNRTLLVRQLGPVLRSLPQRPIAVTTLPIVADLVGLLPVQKWVYYCVDDFGEWPGLAQETLRQSEKRLIQKADALVAVSATLQNKLRQQGKESLLLTHGIEPNFWKMDGPAPAPSQLQGLARPLVVFWGVIDRRMDIDFVRRLATQLADGTIVLVGPMADPDPELLAIPRVVHIPTVPFACLPGVAAASAVLIMPYADLPVTRAMQPLKLKEYLATFRPVVVRDLPANRAWSDCMDIASTPEEFVARVRTRIAEGLPAQHRAARRRLEGETWAEKARNFEQWCLAPRAAVSSEQHYRSLLP